MKLLIFSSLIESYQFPDANNKFASNDFNLSWGVYHPDFPHLLLSVAQMTRAGHSVSFKPGSTCVELQGGRVKYASNLNNLPTVRVHFAKGASATCCTACTTQINDGSSETFCCYLSHALHEQMLQHERFGHFYVPGMKHPPCPACAASKKFGIGHKSERPAYLIPKSFLDCVDWDFKGPLPLSWFNRRWILSAVDQASGWVENYPVFNKSDCA